MGCECCDNRKKDLENGMPESSFLNHNKKSNDNINRKYSLSTDNSEDEREFDNKMNNHQKKEKKKENPNIQNLVNNKQQKIINNNNTDFDEAKARNLVKYLLENDDSIYKDLISTIDNLSSVDFKNLFEGEFEWDFSSNCKSQLKRLAHKFDNFYYILGNCYKESNLYDYLKELWIYYPYINDLKELKDDKKISSKLSSTLPNYSSWPKEIQQDLIKAIQRTEMISSDKIKKIIKDESIEIDKILKKLAKIQETFSNKNDDEADETYLKNNNVLYKDLDAIFNNHSKGKKKQLTSEDKAKIQKNINQVKKDYLDISPYLSENTDFLFDTVLFMALKEIGIKKEYIPFSSLKNSYSDEYEYDDDYDDDIDDDIGSPSDDKNEQENNDKELIEWLSVAKNFTYFIYRGYQLYQTINLSNKIMDKENNEYRKRFNAISTKFAECQNSKRLIENDPIENLEFINKSIDELNEIRDELLGLIEDLKKDIEKNENKKKGIIGNIIYQVFIIGGGIYNLTVKKDPSKLIELLNIGFEISNIVISGMDLSYTNVIIDELIKILKEAKAKREEIETELKSLNEKCVRIRKGYPTYFK